MIFVRNGVRVGSGNTKRRIYEIGWFTEEHIARDTGPGEEEDLPGHPLCLGSVKRTLSTNVPREIQNSFCEWLQNYKPKSSKKKSNKKTTASSKKRGKLSTPTKQKKDEGVSPLKSAEKKKLRTSTSQPSEQDLLLKYKSLQTSYYAQLREIKESLASI